MICQGSSIRRGEKLYVSYCNSGCYTALSARRTIGFMAGPMAGRVQDSMNEG
jgi:hypothetical protein